MAITQSFDPTGRIGFGVDASRGRIGSAIALGLAACGSGVIVTVIASPFVPTYGAFKAVTTQMTRPRAVAWSPPRVRVNALAPGFAETAQTLPALFPLTTASTFVTGHMLTANGGYSVAH